MSILLNPKKYRDRGYPDERSKEIMLKTIEWFENLPKQSSKNYQFKVWGINMLFKISMLII